jgi:hypothetical protein
MTARQFALKAPAAIFFILKLLYGYGHCTMVMSVHKSQAFWNVKLDRRFLIPY